MAIKPVEDGMEVTFWNLVERQTYSTRRHDGDVGGWGEWRVPLTTTAAFLRLQGDIEICVVYQK